MKERERFARMKQMPEFAGEPPALLPKANFSSTLIVFIINFVIQSKRP